MHHPYLTSTTHHQRHRSLKSVSTASTCSSVPNTDHADHDPASNKYSSDEFAKMLNAFDSPVILKAFKSGQIAHQSSPNVPTATRTPLASFSLNTRSPSSSSSSSVNNYKLSIRSTAHHCTPASSVASDSSPLIFSRRSSCSSLASCDVKSIHSTYSSEYSSGLMTPSEFSCSLKATPVEQAHQNSINEPNTTCDEATIVEKTLINSSMNTTVLNKFNSPVVDRSLAEKIDDFLSYPDETVLYELEGESMGKKSISELSKISEICREEAALDETINSDLKSIFLLLGKNMRKATVEEVKFTPPVKLERRERRLDCDVFECDDFEPRLFECEEEERCGSPASVLSVPSVVSEDQKRELVLNYGESVEKRSNSPVNCHNSLNQSLVEEDETAFVAEKRELETVHEDGKGEEVDDVEEDDKILLEFINKMLPIVSQTQRNVSVALSVKSVETPVITPCTKLSKVKGGLKKAPVVNMTRTSLLRAVKAQKLKKEMEKARVKNSWSGIVKK